MHDGYRHAIMMVQIIMGCYIVPNDAHIIGYICNSKLEWCLLQYYYQLAIMSVKHETSSSSTSPDAAECSGTSSGVKNKRHELQEGFDCIFVEEPPKHLQTDCSICMCVLKNPYLVDCCGISFCQSCIKPIQDDSKPCPVCNVNFTT